MTTITEKLISKQQATLLGHFEHGSTEWHNARAGIGGSDIGTIVGLNRWMSAYRLWAIRTGQITVEDNPSLPMELGTYLEPFIRDRWANQNKDWLTVHETGTWQSLENSNFKANPDGIIEWKDGELGILEIKYSSRYWEELPPAYEAQVQWYLRVLGLNRAVIVALVAGEMKEYLLEYDREKTDFFVEQAERFLSLVERGSPPDWDGSFSTYETVRETAQGLVDDVTDLGDLWIHLKNAKDDYDRAEAEFTKFKSITLSEMNGIKTGLYDGQPVIKLQARNGKPFITFAKEN